MGDGRDTAAMPPCSAMASDEARFITGTKIMVDGGSERRATNRRALLLAPIAWATPPSPAPPRPKETSPRLSCPTACRSAWWWHLRRAGQPIIIARVIARKLGDRFLANGGRH